MLELLLGSVFLLGGLLSIPLMFGVTVLLVVWKQWRFLMWNFINSFLLMPILFFVKELKELDIASFQPVDSLLQCFPILFLLLIPAIGVAAGYRRKNRRLRIAAFLSLAANMLFFCFSVGIPVVGIYR